jgi:4-hydroxy-2-oxoheptanedioate aldolase
MMCSLKERLARDEVVLGVAASYPGAGIVEEIGRGWDFVWVDGQHGQMDYQDIIASVRAAQGCQLPTLVRVPNHDCGTIGTILDMAVNALMVPMVDTPEQAQHIVQAGRFPPLGNRSFGGKRCDTFHGREFYLSETDRVLLVAQIETIEAVKNVEAIAAVDGIDTLFFGPDDMKIRMGISINTPIEESDELTKAMQTVIAAAKGTGKTAGIVAGNEKSCRHAVSLGYRLIVGGSDIGFLRAGSQNRLAELRKASS